MSLARPNVVVVLAAAACLASAVACTKDKDSGGAAGNAATASAVPSTISSSATVTSTLPRAQFGMRGGASAAFFRAASALPDLKDTQRSKIEELDKSLRPDGAATLATADAGSPRAELKDLHDDLVAGVKAGKIDTTKLAPRYAALETSANARHQVEATALDGLHDALDPAQRKAITADIRAKEQAREDRMKTKEAPKPDELAKRRLDRMNKELTLDDAQQKKVLDIMTKEATASDAMRADGRKRMDALLTAFEADTFSAEKQDAFSQAGKLARAAMEREGTFLAQILPILKADQRDKLATKLDHRPEMGLRQGDNERGFSPLWEEEGERGMPGGMPPGHGGPGGMPLGHSGSPGDAPGAPGAPGN